MPLHVLKHRVAEQYLTTLRDKTTDHARFRSTSDKLATMLIHEATRDLPTEPTQVETPLEWTEGVRVLPVTVVAILRAGLGMVQVATQLIPEVGVGYVGMERDESTAVAAKYYCKLPEVKGRRTLVVDPMLATGGSAEQTIKLVRERGATDVAMVCVVAAPEGVQRLLSLWPDMDIHTAALDRQLDGRKYILPGLGDFGDRLCGTG